ncbi:hypothetical protein H112_08836 [Trichophyton rubrum D6]|uniref:Uncharacterized protein n=3 Tax=Trichophyton TaxID=5550 RepID=A0A080WEH9_TRIRC|nr:uncharacterized protein TERG_11708 [Trichophyton rubrum CBS 118892]EZF09809.1 hypothetical protein H100_08857 [Trichophyton rubrum MR850]EZF36671.1 hypothetical protein H102_08818 [Trichophyton rubrum CBS 100081]EZF47263.1 hypothetical protein H103_08840 [Trichophyton rubrum CBS 288.86]EZF58001.1 hypothetical protein H104_08788 [Trichophyton rubrum CBS 289.86]EZF68507.1 hypothetical protein H105_08843 [Trichophyton soudanense CBS 452.61]EZF79219.1 hypothetical protein H110_08841 [Trichophy
MQAEEELKTCPKDSARTYAASTCGYAFESVSVYTPLRYGKLAGRELLLWVWWHHRLDEIPGPRYGAINRLLIIMYGVYITSNAITMPIVCWRARWKDVRSYKKSVKKQKLKKKKKPKGDYQKRLERLRLVGLRRF